MTTRKQPGDGPLAVLKFLLGIHADKSPQAPDRDRICRAVGASPRSAKRWLAHLKLEGAIEIQRGGDCLASKIRVVMTLDEYVARPKTVARPNGVSGPSEPKFGPSERVLNLKVFKHIRKKESEAGRKNDQDQDPRATPRRPQGVALTCHSPSENATGAALGPEEFILTGTGDLVAAIGRLAAKRRLR